MTAQEIEELLTGQHVKLYPYTRGQWPPETLFNLWRLMKDQGATNKVFWGNQPEESPEFPFSRRGDLVEFVKFFNPDAPIRRFVFMAQSQKNPADVAGLTWFDDYVPKVRVSAGVFVRRKYWGEPGREASRLSMRWAFEALDVREVWSYTPWHTAQRHAEALGFKPLAQVPEFAVIDGRPHTLHISRARREEWTNG